MQFRFSAHEYATISILFIKDFAFLYCLFLGILWKTH